MVDPVQKFINNAADTTVHMSIAGVAGYLCARLFTRANPIHGAIFSAIAALVFKVANPIFAKFFAGDGANDSSKFVGIVLSVTCGVLASAALSTAFGFPITFTTGLVLACSVVALATIAQMALSYAGINIGGSILP